MGIHTITQSKLKLTHAYPHRVHGEGKLAKVKVIYTQKEVDVSKEQ